LKACALSNELVSMPRLALLATVLVLAGAGTTVAATAPADPVAAPAGVYVLDRAHTSLAAKVRRLGLSVFTLRFERFDAGYDYDPGRPELSRITVTIDANAVDVGNPRFGAQFARRFLGADRFPEITFTSAGVQRTGPGHGLLTGDLTLNGVTRPVTLDVAFDGSGPTAEGDGYRMGFWATADVKRSDFGLKSWESLVGDNVRLLIEAQFVHK
jgi:polyisoprenoid-binding protein YceI